MPAIDVSDEVFIAATPGAVAERFADPAQHRRYWPDLVLRVDEARGAKGVRWSVAGPLTGTMEVWLEPVLDGTVRTTSCAPTCPRVSAGRPPPRPGAAGWRPARWRSR